MFDEKLFVKKFMVVENRDTGRRYECFPQIVRSSLGKYVLRYNVGINGYGEWTFIHAIYDNDEFNRMYKVIAE